MEEFYVDVELNRGLTRFQVDEVPPEEWDLPYTPQFIVEFHNGKNFITLTLRLEQGQWFDCNTRFRNDDFHLNNFDLSANTWNPEYQSPLCQDEINRLGMAIASHMVVLLQAYMGLFTPVFPSPAVN